MAQSRQECLEFLEKAREAMDEASVSIDREGKLKEDEQRLNRELEAEKKLVADTVRQTIKKRRDEISSTYDAEINKAQGELKKVRSRRENAKNQGMKGRIQEETAVLREQNEELTDQMKTVFRQDHVPFYCRSHLYYSLYFPRWAKEIFTLLGYVAIFYLLLPCGVYFLIPDRKPLYLAGIYLVVILVFGGIYMFIGNHTKLHYMEPLKRGRQILDQMHANQKKINVITSTIRKDRNESLYDLGQYDDEIARVQQELADISDKKKEALNTFETVTKTILQDEIEHNHQEKLDSLQQEYSDVSEQLKTTSAEVKAKRLYITDHYGTYLGKEFLDHFKIGELMKILQEGRAENISEAIEVYNSDSRRL